MSPIPYNVPSPPSLPTFNFPSPFFHYSPLPRNQLVPLRSPGPDVNKYRSHKAEAKYMTFKAKFKVKYSSLKAKIKAKHLPSRPSPGPKYILRHCA